MLFRYVMSEYKLYHGDCLEILPRLAAEGLCVNMIFAARQPLLLQPQGGTTPHAAGGAATPRQKQLFDTAGR